MTDREDDRFKFWRDRKTESRQTNSSTQKEIDRFKKDKQGLKTVADLHPLSPLPRQITGLNRLTGFPTDRQRQTDLQETQTDIN